MYKFGERERERCVIFSVICRIVVCIIEKKFILFWSWVYDSVNVIKSDYIFFL